MATQSSCSSWLYQHARHLPWVGCITPGAGRESISTCPERKNGSLTVDLLYTCSLTLHALILASS